MVVALVLIFRVVLLLRRSVGHHLFGVDRADGTHVGLIARGARRALFGVHVQEAVAEGRDRVRIRRMTVFDLSITGLDLREQHVVRRVELVDALHRADIDARTILYVDASFGDDRDTGHELGHSLDLATQIA